MYQILINGVDRTRDVFALSPRISDVLNDRQSTATFLLMNRFSLGWPDNEQEVIFTLADGTRLFGGVIVKIDFQSKGLSGSPQAIISCQDFVRLFDSNLVKKTYKAMTDQAVINDILATFCVGTGITGVNVGLGTTLSDIKFNYIQPSQAMRKITDNTGFNWYIDYYKDLHYFGFSDNPAPFNIDTSTDNKVNNLILTRDNTQLKNRVYVRGSTRLSDNTIYKSLGDGQKTQFILPAKPHNITVKVNGTTKTLGIVNIDTSGFDWYVNYDNKYIQQDSGATVLSTSDVLEVDFTYDLPIIVAVEDSASIAEFGVKEFAISDTTITTSQAAIDRAVAELSDYGSTLNSGSFSTFTNGLRSGQLIHITSADYSISADYLIQKVNATSMGGGQFRYDVTLASAKVMGIIRFLIEMLETQQNGLDVSDNEIVDNLQNISDTLSTPSESITATLGPLSQNWASSGADTTHAVWDLFQWG